MKLRNKKTGEIIDTKKDYNLNSGSRDDRLNIVIFDDEKKDYHYNSLAELNEEWEDYTPQEPLIKDEKLRKALWVWADENRIKKVGFKLDNGNTLCACYFYDESCEVCEFGLKFYLPIDADKIYTITELCGEEE